MYWIVPVNNSLKLLWHRNHPPSAFSFTGRTNMTWMSCLIYLTSYSLIQIHTAEQINISAGVNALLAHLLWSVCVFRLTVWMCQWLSSAGVWTCCVFLSTVRLRWVLSRSSFTWCQCWSSSRLPRETRSWPPEDELTPATQRERGDGERLSCWCHNAFQSGAMSPAKAEISLCTSPAKKLRFFFLKFITSKALQHEYP